MRSPRYTILIANRNTGSVRRLTLARRTAWVAFAGLTVVPLLIGLGASGVSPVEVDGLRTANESLRVENESYRVATSELADQISSLQSALAQLGDTSQLDPAAKKAIEALPALARSRAVGGAVGASAPSKPVVASNSLDGTFGILKGLLGALESRLATVKSKIESEQALERATPKTWPLFGWLSSGFGSRQDPFDTATTDFHSGLDIAAERGTPVHATADGTVEMAAFNGNYGNSVLISHGYGLSTRFGHLSAFGVSEGQKVKRGDIIGYVGSTGRATSAHLHYEILFNGQAINPLRFLGK